jgi:hypothetical protein
MPKYEGFYLNKPALRYFHFVVRINVEAITPAVSTMPGVHPVSAKNRQEREAQVQHSFEYRHCYPLDGTEKVWHNEIKTF